MSDLHRKQASTRDIFFDRQAERWSHTHYGPRGGMVSRIERFAESLYAILPPPVDVLDYGCGTGDLAVALAARGYRVVACDVAAKMIENAQRLYAGAGVSFSVVASQSQGADIVLPTPDQQFDVIICSSVLEYVHDLPGSLKALARALKPGGWLLATVPEISHPLRRHESWHRSLMCRPWLRTLIRRTPFGPSYELQWLSHNRFPVADWADYFRAAGMSPVWRDCQDHPLMLLAGQRNP